MITQKNIHAWIQEVQAFKPQADALVARLQTHGAIVQPEKTPDVASLRYIVQFAFDGGVVTTILIVFKDHQSDSDIVITNMTTLPRSAMRKGFGSRAIAKLLQWAHDNQLYQICATQVNGHENEQFWRKNGFVQQPEPNPFNDFVISLKQEQQSCEPYSLKCPFCAVDLVAQTHCPNCHIKYAI